MQIFPLKEVISRDHGFAVVQIRAEDFDAERHLPIEQYQAWVTEVGAEGAAARLAVIQAESAEINTPAGDTAAGSGDASTNVGTPTEAAPAAPPVEINVPAAPEQPSAPEGTGAPATTKPAGGRGGAQRAKGSPAQK